MDYAEGIAIDTFKNIHISGGSRSNEYSFPVVVGPDLSYNGWGDVFVARLNTMGTEIDYCGYIGGIENDASWGGMVTDHNGDAYVAGLTYSDESSFPAINGPDLSHNGDYDAFIAKVMYIPPLTADSLSLSALNGGTVNFSLDAATWNADRYYLLLGGVTGTKPGTPLPGGYATLPLNMDVFTDIVFANLNGPLFSSFLGQLDADGRADASLFSPPLPSVAVGVNLYFAFCCNNPFDFVSNPLQVEIVP